MRAIRTPLLLATFAGTLAWGLAAGCRTVTPAALPLGPPRPACADCHVEIAREWRDSPHADAWESAEFVAASHGRTDAECLGCHAPTPLLEDPPGRRPALRAARRADGVDCNACHQCGCAFAGPYRTVGPHAMLAAPRRLRSNDLCAACHEAEQREHETLYRPVAGPGARTCVECHMPARHERLTQHGWLSWLHPPRLVRGHAFATWRSPSLATALEVRAFHATVGPDGLAVEVVLVNAGAGHRVPTGEHGHRELEIRVVALDATGAGVGEAAESLLADLGDGLAPGVPRALRLALSPTAPPTRVALRVTRLDASGATLATLLERTAPVERP
jgi:hypothetical protein